MSQINLETLKNTCAGDQDMMKEMLNMGLFSVSTALTDIGSAIASQQWDHLARAVHKVRPVLSYFGISSLNDDLLAIERDARERKALASLPAQVSTMTGKLKVLHVELEQRLSALRG
jgi:HPt (histidine-containing phosphotransfer) domain-containing protein